MGVRYRFLYMLTKIEINSKFYVFKLRFYPEMHLYFCEQKCSISYRNIQNVADFMDIKCKIILRKRYLRKMEDTVCVFTDIGFILGS